MELEETLRGSRGLCGCLIRFDVAGWCRIKYVLIVYYLLLSCHTQPLDGITSPGDKN